MSLKTLASQVFQRDSTGTRNGTYLHTLSQRENKKIEALGTVNAFPLTQDRIDEHQERAAIMEFDGGMKRRDSEAAAWGAYERQFQKMKCHNGNE